MDIKELNAEHLGLELWKPVLKAAFRSIGRSLPPKSSLGLNWIPAALPQHSMR